MRGSTVVIAAALLISIASPAPAQTVDIGGGVSKTKVFYEGDDYVSVGPTVTVHLAGPHAIQLLTDINVRRWDYQGNPTYLDVRGIYFIQYRYTIGAPDRRVAFSVAIGTAGGVERHRTSAFTYTEHGHYEQGTWVESAPVTRDFPAVTRWSVGLPIVPAIGFGMEVKATRRIAVRADLSVAVGPYLVAASRAAAGVVVHLGGR
jgi:hypothetical protein